jgi:hypothetical protein
MKYIRVGSPDLQAPWALQVPGFANARRNWWARFTGLGGHVAHNKWHVSHTILEPMGSQAPCLVGNVDVRPGRDQQARDLHLVSGGRDVEDRDALLPLGAVHSAILALSDYSQREHRARVALHGQRPEKDSAVKTVVNMITKVSLSLRTIMCPNGGRRVGC